MNLWRTIDDATKKSIYVMLIICGLIIIVVPTVWLQNTQKAESRMNASTLNDSNATDTLIIDIKLSTVNTDDYSYTLLMNLKPSGNLMNQKGNLTRFNGTIDLSIKGERFSLFKDSPTSAIHFKSNFASGTSNSFPFDAYIDEFDISGTLMNETNSQAIKFINVVAAYTGNFDSFDAEVFADSFQTKSTVRLRIKRTGTTQFFSVSVVILMWALSLTILTVAVTIWVRKRVVEPPVI